MRVFAQRLLLGALMVVACLGTARSSYAQGNEAAASDTLTLAEVWRLASANHPAVR